VAIAQKPTGSQPGNRRAAFIPGAEVGTLLAEGKRMPFPQKMSFHDVVVGRPIDVEVHAAFMGCHVFENMVPGPVKEAHLWQHNIDAISTLTGRAFPDLFTSRPGQRSLRYMGQFARFAYEASMCRPVNC
jgi:hypothetical protein